MKRALVAITALCLISVGAGAQTPGTLNLYGPSTSPGAPAITPQALGTAINTQLGGKLDTAAIGTTVAPLAGGMVPPSYLPPATTGGLGAVKAGSGLSVAGDGTLSLPSLIGSPGAYNNITVDAFGRITSVRGFNAGDITGALGYTPPQLGTTTGTAYPGNLGAADNALAVGAVQAAGGTLTNGTLSGGSASGTDVSAAIALGRTIEARAQDRINVKDLPYLAQGATLGESDASISASSSSLTTATTTFTSASVGDEIVVHGAGASGSPLLTTISAYVGPHAVTLSAAASTTVSSANFEFGPDDTAAIASAATVAAAEGKALYFPAGAYWIASQSTPMSLTNVSVIGDGIVARSFPFTNQGSTLVITGTTSAVFNPGTGVSMKGMTAYWPMQDGTQVAVSDTVSIAGTTMTSTQTTYQPGDVIQGMGVNTGTYVVSGSGTSWMVTPSQTIGPVAITAYRPLVYPAFFESTQFGNGDLSNDYFVNPYKLIQIDNGSGGSGMGRVYFHDIHGYCVYSCLYMQNGAADTISIDQSVHMFVGFYPPADVGYSNLDKWTTQNGEWMHVDTGSGNYGTVDGITLKGVIFHGERYGIRVVSGGLNVAKLEGIVCDSCQTMLSVEGTATVATTTISGGDEYCNSIWNSSLGNPCINLASTAQQGTLTIDGVTGAFSQGDFLLLANPTLLDLSFTSNNIQDWGEDTVTGQSFYGLYLNNAGIIGSISGNKFSPGTTTGQTKIAINIITGGQYSIAGNECDYAWNCVRDAASQGTATLHGNSSFDTKAATPVSDVTTGTALIVAQGDNSWDIAPTWRNPAVSSCGTSPTVASGSGNYSGNITVGSGTVTSCTVTFTTPLPYTPRIIRAQTNVAAVNAAVTAQSASAFTVSFSANAAGDQFSYQVVP